MKEGRISETSYNRTILNYIKEGKDSMPYGASAQTIKLEDSTLVLSSNYMLKNFDGCEDYYVVKALNDLRASGKPEVIRFDIAVSTKTEERSLGKVVERLYMAAEKYNLKICGCSVYSDERLGTMTKPLIHVTVLGRSYCDILKIDTGFFDGSLIKAGHDIVMAGSAGLGMCHVLARAKKDVLTKRFSGRFYSDCRDISDKLSNEYIISTIVEICASGEKIYLMKPVSEGGVFSSLWQVGSLANAGVRANLKEIPVYQECIEVSEVFGLNPYASDGTGGVLVICENGESLSDKLLDRGILSANIGMMTKKIDRVIVNGEDERYLEPPRGDAIYDIL